MLRRKSEQTVGRYLYEKKILYRNNKSGILNFVPELFLKDGSTTRFPTFRLDLLTKDLDEDKDTLGILKCKTLF